MLTVSPVLSQQLWGEIGKSREERERMVREMEAECMRVYRRKVEEATGERALLHQSLAAGEAEIAALTAALGADNSPQLKVYIAFFHSISVFSGVLGTDSHAYRHTELLILLKYFICSIYDTVKT